MELRVFSLAESYPLGTEHDRDIFYRSADSMQQDSPLRQAVKEGNLARVQQLIHHYDINMPNYKGWTLIHESAVSDKLFDIFQYLISAGAKVDFRTEEGVSPLYVACAHGSLKIAKTLIDAGCEINAKFSFDYEFDRRQPSNFTPLHIACIHNRTPVIELLTKNNADVNSRDTTGRTPAYYALIKNNYRGFLYLSRAGADLVAKDIHGCSLLHHVTEIRHHYKIFHLIKNHYVDKAILNDQTLKGRTVLMSACYNGNAVIAKELIKLGADTTLVDSDGLLAIHLAARNGYVTFKLLLEHTPVDIIEKYSTYGSEKWCSLPCCIIESKSFRSLQLLYNSGLSEAVLKCPYEMSNTLLLSPVACVLMPAFDELDDLTVLKYLNILLSYDFLLDPVYENDWEILPEKRKFCKISALKRVNSIEAVIQRHYKCYYECYCKTFLPLILSKTASPWKILPRGYSRQIDFFTGSARYGFMEALHLLKYAEYVEPDDVLRMFLSEMLKPQYKWAGYEEESAKFLLEKCTTNFMQTFLEVKRFVKQKVRTEPLTRNTIKKYKGLLNMHKMAVSNNHVMSLKKMCRFTLRKAIRKTAEDSRESFESCLQDFHLPHSLAKYLCHDQDF